ncbi:MAG: hypothetical protein ACREEM_56580 [Blastocatellia bacterium]
MALGVMLKSFSPNPSSIITRAGLDAISPHTFTYKANDLVWTVANQRNITVTNSYNTRNLLEQMSDSDGTPATTLSARAIR